MVDLGKQVPAETIISKAVEINADAIGLSALLVSTSKQMPLIINELQRRGLQIPVLIGGAAINQRFGRRILLAEDGKIYEPGVFYCKDAFEGLSTMDALSQPESRQAILEKIKKESVMEHERASAEVRTESAPARSSVKPAVNIPAAPHWGAKVVRNMPLEIIFKHLAKNELYRLSWGAKNTHGEEWTKLEQEYDARLEKMIREALSEKWLNPQAVYGYWPAQSEGNELILFDPASVQAGSRKELMRFNFARQLTGENLCLADYFTSVDSGRMDVVAFQVVTVGQKATDRFDKLQAAADYTEGYFTHGLAVQTAEATADYLHNFIRGELGLGKDQGKRYSWGYPAIPDTSEHRKVFNLLPAEKELGMNLTEGFQMVPEQSTAAIIVHHPEAKYYNIGESRVDQLMKAKES